MKTLPSCEDYITSIEVPKLVKATELDGGSVVRFNGSPILYAGGFCVVFPYILSNSKKVAVRCWTAHITDADKRSKTIASELKRSHLPYFVEFTFIPQGIATSKGVFPIVIMDWVEALTLKEYVKKHISQSSIILRLADQFKSMASDLHKFSFSHGDLQHGNIMVTKDGKIILVDYDSMFVPGLENVSDEIKGLEGYQHPDRVRQRYLNPKSDYFSEIIIYTSLIALAKYPKLWTQLNIENTETLLFAQEDLDNPNRALIFNELKKDSDLKPLVEAIEKALRTQRLEDLLPLEEAIIPESTRIIETLQNKWNKNKRPIPSKEETHIDLECLSRKWGKNQSKPQKEEEINVSSITSKWKNNACNIRNN